MIFSELLTDAINAGDTEGSFRIVLATRTVERESSHARRCGRDGRAAGPVVVTLDDRAAREEIEFGVDEKTGDTEHAERRPDGADEQGLRRRPADVKARDKNIRTGADLRARGDIDQPRR